MEIIVDKEWDPLYDIGFSGWDIDTNRISWGIVDKKENPVSYGWCDLERISGLSNVLDASNYVMFDWIQKYPNLKMSIVEIISPFQKGGHQARVADEINRVGTAVILGLLSKYTTHEIDYKPPRTWMSKTVGLRNKRNPTKEQIAEWCHDKWPQLDPIEPRDSHVITRGPRKGQEDIRLNDCYDTLGVAVYSKRVSFGEL